MTEIKLEERIARAGIASENVSNFLETFSEFYNDEGFRGDVLWGILCDNHLQLREIKQEDKDELLSLLAVYGEGKKVPGVFNVKHEAAIKGEVDIHRLLEIFHKWLYFKNDCDITIPVAFAVSNFTDVDPGCLGIIAPSGSYKTELIRAFGNEENEYVFPIDNLTPHTFVSGMKNVEDIIPQLTRRLILIKDFTTLLSKREDDRTAIFSDIRELLDGYLSRSYGSGKRVSYTDIHSSILLGSTGAIERYYSLNATLGQRIIFFKPKNNATKARERAFENMNKTTEMRIQLHEAMMGFLKGVFKKQNGTLGNVGGNINAQIIETLGHYADFVALARTHILKDFKGEIAGVPEPEFPTRLFKEIIKIISLHAVLYDREVTASDVQAGITVLLGNIPTERLRLLEKLAEEEEGFETTALSSALHISRDVTRKRLEELLVLGIVDRILKSGRTGDIFCIKKYFLIIARHLFKLDVSLFMLGGNPDSRECVNKLSPVSKLQLTNSVNKNSNSNINNINKDKKVLTPILHNGEHPHTNNEKDEKIEEPNLNRYGLPPNTNYAQCEMCAKVATLTSYNLDGREIGICDDCRKELKEIEKTKKPTNTNDNNTKKHDDGAYGNTKCPRCGKNAVLIFYNENLDVCSSCLSELKKEEKKKTIDKPTKTVNIEDINEDGSIKPKAFDKNLQKKQDNKLGELETIIKSFVIDVSKQDECWVMVVAMINHFDRNYGYGKEEVKEVIDRMIEEGNLIASIDECGEFVKVAGEG